jgi:glycosyltransferase involved in cell wall biosynthesis
MMSDAARAPRQTWAVIPALNEQQSLESVLRGVAEAGMHSIVVDDGSTDRTGEIARGLADVCLRHERARGYGLALAAGMHMLAERADVSWVVTLDADGQLDPREAAAAIRRAEAAGATVCIGRRARPPRLVERIAAPIFRHMFGIEDPFCGMKAFRADVLRRHLEYAGAHVNLALCVKAVRAGERLYQTPVQLALRVAGRSSFGGARGQLKLVRAVVATLFMGLSTGPQ